MSQIAHNLGLIKDKVFKTCQIYNRDLATVNLIAVSKTVAAESIQNAIDSGCNTFGENYIKEVKEKWPSIREKNPDVKLHFIGHLQSNKAGEAVELFDCVQTLDSEKLALAFKKQLSKSDKKDLEFFIQVNIGEEPQKGGIDLDKVNEFVNFCQNECQLNVTGLMCIPPQGELPSPYFALLRKKADECGLKKLSMGMSADYAEGVALGSTHIRIGSSIFGKRS